MDERDVQKLLGKPQEIVGRSELASHHPRCEDAMKVSVIASQAGSPHAALSLTAVLLVRSGDLLLLAQLCSSTYSTERQLRFEVPHGDQHQCAANR